MGGSIGGWAKNILNPSNSFKKDDPLSYLRLGDPITAASWDDEDPFSVPSILAGNDYGDVLGKRAKQERLKHSDIPTMVLNDPLSIPPAIQGHNAGAPGYAGIGPEILGGASGQLAPTPGAFNQLGGFSQQALQLGGIEPPSNQAQNISQIGPQIDPQIGLQGPNLSGFNGEGYRGLPPGLLQRLKY